MNTLRELQQWFTEQCNGDWEHQQGIIIESCDNPGWWVRIDLANTSLQKQRFETISENIDIRGYPTSDEWLRCYIENGVWKGAGDINKLETILEKFLSWAKTIV